ncbi:MAG: hypothetical protein IKY70_06870 [Bacteroidales bacterium]|nr:hypothetical protein [Bacteroidales bacterium]
MGKRLIFSLVALVLYVGSVFAQQDIIGPQSRVASSFAIFIDDKSYEACKDAVMAYKNLLEKEGLATYLLVAEWESPEHVKYFLEKYYKEQAMEGAVFIGNIPIPMIRKAQHMTSAFKMNERYDMRETSVPSDRFYDDFDLKFNFIKRDSVETNLFYYNLAGESAQRINCEIYTGRIKPTKEGNEGYEQISKYLNKVVAERQQPNMLDKVVSYTGHGSFSNSLEAWKDECITLREQMPAAFNKADGAKFYMFYMYPSMKRVMTQELQRPDVDVMLFHEHGLPHRQYLTGNPDALSDDENFEAGKLYLRNMSRREKQMGNDPAEYQKKMAERYNLIDSVWFAGAFDPEVIAQDSINDLLQGIILEDIPQIKPNARFVIFDACYNGDFREPSCVASEYIFADGKTVACFANSVNVLQDKSSSDLMGLLSCGFRLGQWTKYINILESHIIGDPTYRFAKSYRLPEIKINLKDVEYWMAVMSHNLPADLKGLALYKLFDMNYEQMPELLMDTYKNSDSYMLRLQCLHLAAYYPAIYSDILKLAVKDPYEFIRRKAVYYMGNVGRNDFIPYIVDLYMDDFLSERIEFNAIRTGGMLNVGILKEAFKNRIEADKVYNGEEFFKAIEKGLNSGESMRDFVWGALIDKSASPRKRMAYITSIKNNPYNQLIHDLVLIVKDSNEPEEMRIGVTEALGWYVHTERKAEIVDACKAVLSSNEELSEAFKDELNKTINRLETYMR